MQASRIMHPGEVQVVDMEVADPGPGEVLVRPLYVSLCGSDVYHLLYRPPEEYPLDVGSSGHEMVGVIEGVGNSVEGLLPGTIALVLSPEHTALAQRYIAPAECVHERPEGMPLEDLLMAQQLGTVVFSVRRLPNLVGATSAVIGQGSAGVFWAQMLRRLGCRRIVVMDRVASRVEAGRRFGADVSFDNTTDDPEDVVRKATDGKMADVVVEAAGDAEAINLAPRLLCPGGVLFFFGVPHSPTIEFDYWSFFRAYARTFSCSGAMLEPGGACFQTAIELLHSGAIKVEGMVTHRVPFAEVEHAFELARTGKDGAHKVVIVMPETDPG